METNANFSTNDDPAVRLRAPDSAALAAHFTALRPADRRLRFGAVLADEGIAEYVARIDFERDCVFAIHDERLRIVAAVHVAMNGALAELGLSVLPAWRDRGLGNALFGRALNWLRNRGVAGVYVHCIAENGAMMRLARKNGMRIAHSGGDSDGRLELDAPTAESYVAEWLEDQRGRAAHELRRHRSEVPGIARES